MFILGIIIIIIYLFVLGIYTYIPKTNHVCREYSVAAILQLMSVVHVTLFPMLNLSYFYISAFRSVCELPCRAVFCGDFIIIIIIIIIIIRRSNKGYLYRELIRDVMISQTGVLLGLTVCKFALWYNSVGILKINILIYKPINFRQF